MESAVVWATTIVIMVSWNEDLNETKKTTLMFGQQ
jgi:hypothetical protein